MEPRRPAQYQGEQERALRAPDPTVVTRARSPRGATAAREEPGPGGLTRPLPLVLIALWLGLVGGLLELGLMLGQRWFSGTIPLESLRTNRHFLWMVPTSEAALLTTLGLVLSAVVRIGPRRASRPVLGVVCFVAALAPLLSLPGLHALAGVVLAAGIAVRAVVGMGRRPETVRRWVFRSLPLLGVLVGGLVGLDARQVTRAERRALVALPAAAPGAPNVLLIVLDTVRADHLTLYGYRRDTAPNLTRLARTGVRYAHARATAPWTLPSHASMLTGRWPHELPARSSRALDATYPTLAEFLAHHGYATAGFVANTTYCNARFGLDRGFARYEDYVENDVVSAAEVLRCSALGRRLVALAAVLGIGPPGAQSLRKDAARINRDFLNWLAQRPGGRPFFAFLNYLDAHDPYLVPPGFTPHFGLQPVTPSDSAVLQKWDTLSKWRLPQRQIDLARDAYDDCIAYLDDQLGRLFAALERCGVLEDTLVIVTADHGESWGEHQLFGHWRSLYQAEVHVPLVIAGPPWVPAGRVIAPPVSLRALPATVADLLGLSAASPFPGRSLASHWNSAAVPAEPVLCDVIPQARGPGRLLAALGPVRSLVAEGKVYIQNGVGREELYDLETDPAETHNLAATADARPLLLRFRETLERLAPGAARPRSAGGP